MGFEQWCCYIFQCNKTVVVAVKCIPNTITHTRYICFFSQETQAISVKHGELITQHENLEEEKQQMEDEVRALEEGRRELEEEIERLQEEIKLLEEGIRHREEHSAQLRQDLLTMEVSCKCVEILSTYMQNHNFF